VRADEESHRARSESMEEQSQDNRRRIPGTRDPEERIAEAADQHRAREAAGERPPRGKL